MSKKQNYDSIIRGLLELVPASNQAKATVLIKRLVNNPNKQDKMMLATRAMIVASQVCGATLDEMMSNNRCRYVVNARMLTSYYIRNELNLTYEHIGRLFGGKDHATILHMLRKFTELVEVDKQFQKLYQEFNIIMNTDNEINHLSKGQSSSPDAPLDVLVHRITTD